MYNKRGQLTIFIIIAVIIVALIIGIFIFKDKIFPQAPSTETSEIETTFLSCIKDYASSGIDVLESQGGYIYLPEFEPGSSYMPFSSQLNFLGNSIPYWYYVSQNNIQREQIPSKSEMEQQLARFIQERIKNCNFQTYYDQGYKINLGDSKVETNINDKNVDILVTVNMEVIKGEQTSKVVSHRTSVNSKLGILYNSAKSVYDYEQKNLFLEEYAIDNLRSYAPVDGVEISCSPKIWPADTVFNDLKNGIEANTLALKANGQYSLTNKEGKYFVLNLPVQEKVRFVNSKDWAYAYEVEPNEGSLLIANPIGNQPGMGILGFCYIPYHFVYNIKYPVLIQVGEETEEMFQFPMAVVVQGNNPRESLKATATEETELSELCNYKNTNFEVQIYDENLNPIDAEISFECFGTKCNIGETTNGILNSDFPQCANGYILARKDGYSEGKYLQSTISSGQATIILEKLKEIKLNLKLDNQAYSGTALITFEGENSNTIAYPEQNTVELKSGLYNMTAYVYKEGQIKLAQTVKEQCVEIPVSGIGGLFGMTKKKCLNVEIPEQIVSNVLAGGGSINYYITNAELSSGNLYINVESLPTPTTVEELQNNYILFDSKKLDVTFG
ncbi:MAG: hypothetical protein Q7R52_03435 [archaeon]|nr:hypothetical protein [archaeon]